jgi:serine/threonine protein kinase
MTLVAGHVFAGYTILRPLGAGGMGEVYLTTHPRLPRHDALKILPAMLSEDAEYRARFEREADLASTLWHPHIVGVHDRGEAEGRLWMSMDFVDGQDAARLVGEVYPTGMPATMVADIVTAIASALDYAHKQGLLHRDVKPANIMLTGADDEGVRRILLADFGIARAMDDISGLTATNVTMGTVDYCAPEQLMGEPIDGRTDQYSLAATAYYLLTGTPTRPRWWDDTSPPAAAAGRIEAGAVRCGRGAVGSIGQGARRPILTLY